MIVVTGEEGGQYGYHDFWDPDGVFHYYGAGQLFEQVDLLAILRVIPEREVAANELQHVGARIRAGPRSAVRGMRLTKTFASVRFSSLVR